MVRSKIEEDILKDTMTGVKQAIALAELKSGKTMKDKNVYLNKVQTMATLMNLMLHLKDRFKKDDPKTIMRFIDGFFSDLIDMKLIDCIIVDKDKKVEVNKNDKLLG